MDRPNPKTGRKPIVTSARVDLICSLLAEGESETAGCRLAGVGLTAWHEAKKKSQTIRDQIAAARDQWARLRYQRHMAALYQSQAMRAASRKAQRPRPIHQANLVVWHLSTRVPINIIAIPDEDIAAACQSFDLSLETWWQQARAFGLMQKVYGKRSKIRGQQPPLQTVEPLYIMPEQPTSDNPFMDQWRA
jgi:hypothetical protein